MREIRRVRGRDFNEEKKLAAENTLEEKVVALQRLEDKTDKMLKKSEQKEGSRASTSHIQPVHKPYTRHIQSRRDVSYLTFQCLPPSKAPFQVLTLVKSNAFSESGHWYSKLDSYKAIEAIGTDSHHLRMTVMRLKKEGWFEVLESSGSGYRLLKIDPKIFGLEK
jgi:hypothetical protein